jgi:uncharacterized damage-inducible protein DinB
MTTGTGPAMAAATMPTMAATAAAPATTATTTATRVLTNFFLAELDKEVRPTRKMLERVPMERGSWQPHGKSMALGGLATHVANLPSWAVLTVNQDELDIAPVGAPPYKMEPFTSTSELLAAFDKNVDDARKALEASTDARLDEDWTLLAGGHKIFTDSKKMVLRQYVFNHIAHHRAQLGVYLRLNGIPVPATYGPSADEND